MSVMKTLTINGKTYRLVTDWNELENRPVQEVPSDTLKWDGDHTSLEKYAADVSTYKVSDSVPTEADLANGFTIEVQSYGSIQTATHDDGSFTAASEGVLHYGSLIYIINETAAAALGIGAGIYFMRNDTGLYTQSFTITGYTGFAKFMIDPKCVAVDNTLTKGGQPADAEATGKAIAEIMKDIADLKYEPVKITSISNNVGTVEMGKTVDTLTINWQLNKEPVSQTVNGESVAASVRSAVLNGLRLTATKSFAVTATDEREATASATTAVTFLNGVYYGVLEDGTTLDSAAILTLTRKLQGAKALTFTATAGASQRIAYAIPSRYGTPVFTVGGFDGGFSKAATINFINASGYAESYDVWLSDNTGLGNTTVGVK